MLSTISAKQVELLIVLCSHAATLCSTGIGFRVTTYHCRSGHCIIVMGEEVAALSYLPLEDLYQCFFGDEDAHTFDHLLHFPCHRLIRSVADISYYQVVVLGD